MALQGRPEYTDGCSALYTSCEDCISTPQRETSDIISCQWNFEKLICTTPCVNQLDCPQQYVVLQLHYSVPVWQCASLPAFYAWFIQRIFNWQMIFPLQHRSKSSRHR